MCGTCCMLDVSMRISKADVTFLISFFRSLCFPLNRIQRFLLRVCIAYSICIDTLFMFSFRQKIKKKNYAHRTQNRHKTKQIRLQSLYAIAFAHNWICDAIAFVSVVCVFFKQLGFSFTLMRSKSVADCKRKWTKKIVLQNSTRVQEPKHKFVSLFHASHTFWSDWVIVWFVVLFSCGKKPNPINHIDLNEMPTKFMASNVNHLVRCAVTLWRLW